jgi:hypothetical protein
MVLERVQEEQAENYLQFIGVSGACGGPAVQKQSMYVVHPNLQVCFGSVKITRNLQLVWHPRVLYVHQCGAPPTPSD